MEMKRMDTPLQLDEYFFPHVKVSADPEALGTEVSAKCDFGVKVDGEGSYQVSLVISSSSESEKKRTPYSIELVAIGFFSVSPEWDNPVKLLKINGASILYAAAREFIITITSRGPWGAIMLPTTSFLAMYNQNESVEERKNSPSNVNTETESLKPKKRRVIKN